MKLKGGNFILKNIEKIILPIAGLVFFWILFSKVIMSPNYVEYNGKKYSPGAVDEVIYQKAKDVEYIINSEPTPVDKFVPESQDFIAKFESPLEINPSLWQVLPSYTSGKLDKGQRYAIPEIPDISEASVEHIRAVAYIPTQEITNEVSYQEVETEPNDLDIVTVEAKIDVQKLYEAFEENYAGPSVKPEWRDKDLAEPVFAAVRLERSEQLEDGKWSDYKEVPRIKIDNMTSLLQIIEKIDELPRGGMEVRLLQYKNIGTKSNLLQPMAYDIGSPEEDWFPPTFHREFVKRVEEEEAAKRREELQEKREEREQELELARSRRREGRTRETTRTTGMGGGAMSDLPPGIGGGGMSNLPGGVDGGSSRPRRDRGAEREQRRRELEERRRERGEGSKEDEKSIDAVYKKFKEILIDEDTEFAEMDEPLVFWAHDDSVQVGKTYRYRISLGVFNPVAGTKKFLDDYKSYENKVILWSNSIETEEVKIPQKLYFFANDIREAANAVKVEVFKYVLGYWYPQKYEVKAGEVIGNISKIEEEDDDDEETSFDQIEILKPEEVDFSTGAMMVDTAEVQDWDGINVLLPRNYFTFYYSYDGDVINEMPIQQRFWASETRDLYRKISKASEKEKQPLRDRGEGVRGEGPRTRQDTTDMMFPGTDFPTDLPPDLLFMQ